MRSITSLLCDLVLVAAATVAAVLVRDNLEILSANLGPVAAYLLITVAVAAFVLPAFGVNRSLWQFTGLREYLRIVGAAILMVLGCVAVGFLVNRLDGVARALPLLQALLIISFLIGARVFARAVHGRRAARAVAHAGGGETVLVIGLNKLAELYLQCLAEFDSGRVRVAGVLDEAGRVGLTVHSHPVLGRPDQVAGTLRYLEVRGVFVDRMVVATPRTHLTPATRAALADVQERTTISLDYLTECMGIPDGVEATRPEETSQELAEGFASRTVGVALGGMSYERLKRVIDVAFSGLLLVALAPVILLVTALVALDVGFPVIFWQQRPGLCRRPFKLYKFRTMADDAYDSAGDRLPDSARVSILGRFLRRIRFDELPQLFNILKGDMSFVGPRPLLPVDQPGNSSARLLVRPGLTGWAQIKGGRAVSVSDKVALDLWYVRHMSLMLDLEILLNTVPMVLFGERIAQKAIVQAWRDLEVTGATELAPQREVA